MAPETNYLDNDGANRLRERIADYWLARGYAVTVELVKAEYNQAVRSTRFDVRSDLVNGWPPDYEGDR